MYISHHRDERVGKTLQRKDCRKMEDTGASSTINLYKMKIMLGQG